MWALELSRFIQMPGVVDSNTLVAIAKLTSRPSSSPNLVYVAISLATCRESKARPARLNEVPHARTRTGVAEICLPLGNLSARRGVLGATCVKTTPHRGK